MHLTFPKILTYRKNHIANANYFRTKANHRRRTNTLSYPGSLVLMSRVRLFHSCCWYCQILDVPSRLPLTNLRLNTHSQSHTRNIDQTKTEQIQNLKKHPHGEELQHDRAQSCRRNENKHQGGKKRNNKKNLITCHCCCKTAKQPLYPGKQAANIIINFKQ